MDDYGFWAIIVTRINPFLSNDAISFVGGLLRMGYWKFIGAIYVETLIGLETVNTLPLETPRALRNYRKTAENLNENLGQAAKVLRRLKENGIDIDWITRKH